MNHDKGYPLTNSELALMESARAEELKKHACSFAKWLNMRGFLPQYPIGWTNDNGRTVHSLDILYNLFNPKV